jgi:DNA polymerase (family 10)
MLRAICNRQVDAIGHPTGRLIGTRKPYGLDLEKVFHAAAEHGCCLELNCQPSRLDLDDVAVAAAKRHGVKIVLGSDAHSTEELRFMEYGVYQARRGGLEAGDVLNTLPLPELLKTRRSL